MKSASRTVGGKGGEEPDKEGRKGSGKKWGRKRVGGEEG